LLSFRKHGRECPDDVVCVGFKDGATEKAVSHFFHRPAKVSVRPIADHRVGKECVSR
jgi:hypothetical protein